MRGAVAGERILASPGTFVRFLGNGLSQQRPQRIVPFMQDLGSVILAAPNPASSIALNMPRPGWQVNSETGRLSVRPGIRME